MLLVTVYYIFVYLELQGDLWKGLPSLCFGIFGLVSGTLIIVFLPETLGSKLPETITEAENFGKRLVEVNMRLQKKKSHYYLYKVTSKK